MYKGRKEQDTAPSIYCAPNKYGYRYNVNHPFINDLLLRYLRWKHIPVNLPMTNQERWDFEQYVDSLFENNKNGVIK